MRSSSVLHYNDAIPSHSFQIINLWKDINFQQILINVSGYAGLCEEERPNNSIVQQATPNVHFWRTTNIWWVSAGCGGKTYILSPHFNTRIIFVRL
ncbi:hypothetical protein AVEN_129861-1 [Araneus ventricosus]|uniref:Uncharacterized protein n=1 Tax=Araneus ventricosus TaxID=182803 RepID=A0A4Y2JFP3_ARAVE|nr:hypothetical protein AVEN_129861-1 [Araneus ventricosus]